MLVKSYTHTEKAQGSLQSKPCVYRELEELNLI